METNNKEVDAIRKELDQVNGKLAEIIALLTGHAMDADSGGIVHRVNTNDTRIANLEKFKDRAVYVALGASIPAGWGLIDIITTILNVAK